MSYQLRHDRVHRRRRTGSRPESRCRPRCLGGVGVAVLTVVAAVVGCGRGAGGPPRYELSGSVTYQGKPVPAGYLVFAPDGEQGNQGPGAHADIVDGRYRTPSSEGTVGGPHVVTIAGFDGRPFEIGGGMMNPQGMPLFPEYRTLVDLPKAAGTHDFEIPPGGR